ncbi:MAG: hypothetical protein INH41_10060 [Myxococcaceae bacterium]|nr:hypothetical protein [Myxococcaceae bacterium]
MRLLCLLAALPAIGCVVPRSMALGMMAAPIGRGTEVGLFSGVGYASQTGPVVTSTTVDGQQRTQTQNRVLGLPTFEANVQKGFTDHLALNVHASSAGVQPGLKWTVNRSRVAHFAILPAVAFGFGSLGSSQLVQQPNGALSEVNPASTTSFTFLGGLKLLVSHRSGFYAGVGYDLAFNRTNSGTQPNVNADRTETVTQTLAHQVMGAVGFSIALGQLSLRPEVAFSVTPALSQTVSSRVGATSTGDQALTGGFGWAILPGFTLAVATPRVSAADDEAASDQASGGDAGDAEVEEEAAPSGPPRKRTGDEDDARRKRRRQQRPADDDEGD